MLESLNVGKYNAISCALGTFEKSSLQTLLKIHELIEIRGSVLDRVLLVNTSSAV
jgi:hypothetical protein